MNCANPGLCYESGLQRNSGGLLGFAAGVITCILGRSYDVGARPVTAAAVKFGDEVHGQYVEDNEIRP